jgi:hypothetical protein
MDQSQLSIQKNNKEFYEKLEAPLFVCCPGHFTQGYGWLGRHDCRKKMIYRLDTFIGN